MKETNFFEISDSTLTFDNIVSDASPDVINNLKQKDIVILPSHGTEDLYYVGSIDILDYFKNNNIDIDIYATDEEYQEIALHSAEIWLGTFLLKNIIIPTFIGLLSNYIYNKLKAKPDDNISVTFIAEKKNGNTKKIEYRGEVRNLNKAINSLKKIDREDT
ncbi:hypothetical protein [Psychrobacter sp. I-STPA6b]|uniref:hypothetical protein n=1 Tax=Psychrobacter sp. I-STPA6b TaxID=2585718 RepID=UPI001D0C624A|nr:hypothetical protein [Psychrobacter sp. I-STPA6b]